MFSKKRELYLRTKLVCETLDDSLDELKQTLEEHNNYLREQLLHDYKNITLIRYNVEYGDVVHNLYPTKYNLDTNELTFNINGETINIELYNTSLDIIEYGNILQKKD